MENAEEAQELYNARRKELIKIRADSIDSLDKAIAQIATGTLVVTITFLDKIGKPYDNLTILLLLLSWTLFVVVIVGHLLSFYFATKNANFRIHDLDQRASKYKENWPDSEPAKTNYKSATEICNWLILAIFLAGIILFLTYAALVQLKQYQHIASNNTKEVSMPPKHPTFDGQTEAPESTTLNLKGARTEAPEPTRLEKAQTEAPEQVIINNPGSVFFNLSSKQPYTTDGKKGLTETPE